MRGVGDEVGGVWSTPMHKGHREIGALITLYRKLLKEEQYPERSWERAERRRRAGRSFSSSATAGGGV